MAGFTINRAVQSGNLTRDPELRSLPSGTSVCKLGIAVNERYKDKTTDQWADRAHYFNWTVWGGLGEWVAKELSKGDGVTLEGRAQWHSWEAQDGSKRQAVEFTADSIVPRSGGGGGGGSRQQRESEQAGFTPRDDGFTPRSDVGPQQAPQQQQQPAGPGQADDDIPF